MTMETENNDKELGCDALLCRLRELRDKKNEINREISITEEALKTAKKLKKSRRNSDISKRNLQISKQIFGGSTFKKEAERHGLSQGQTAICFYSVCRKINPRAWAEGTEKGCRRPQLKWIIANRRLFKHNS